MARHGYLRIINGCLSFVRTLQHRQGLNICCPEEIAAELKYISLDELLINAHKYNYNEYGNYLLSVHHMLSGNGASTR